MTYTLGIADMVFLLSIVSGLFLILSAPTEVYVTMPVQQVREIIAEVTAYSASYDETDSEPGITASGELASLGMAACPIWLSFGTKIEVGGEIFVCKDRMAKRYREGAYFDLLMASPEKAMEWGRQIITVLIY